MDDKFSFMLEPICVDKIFWLFAKINPRKIFEKWLFAKINPREINFNDSSATLEIGMGWFKKYMLSNIPNFDLEFKTGLQVYFFDVNERYDSDSDDEYVLDEERNAFDALMDQNPSNM